MQTTFLDKRRSDRFPAGDAESLDLGFHFIDYFTADFPASLDFHKAYGPRRLQEQVYLYGAPRRLARVPPRRG